jgi:CSLREA domain-containing protein
VAVALVALLGAQGAAARTYRVNRTGDPVPGACTKRHCTLREAVIAANSHPGHDVIVLRRGTTYRLAQSGAGEDAALTGDLDVLDSLTIRRAKLRHRRRKRPRCYPQPYGCLGKLAIVDAARLDGVLQTHGAASLTVNGLNVRGGEAPAGQTGGIEADAGTLRVLSSRVGNNTGGGDGGISSEGTLVIKRSGISENRGNGRGGVDADGAALTMVRSAVGFNLAALSGGGVWIRGRGLIKESEIYGNFGAAGGGGIVSNTAATTRVVRSSISLNGTDTGSGGGIASVGTSKLTVLDSTIVDNTSYKDGGGIWRLGGTVTLNNVTVARNTAHSGYPAPTGIGGGGLYSGGAGSFIVRNSLIALNKVGSGGADPNCHGSFSSVGHNLRGTADPGCTGFTGAGDFVNGAPRLQNPKGGLANNGGPTQTLALLKGSPAINRGGHDALTRDQRGVRKVGRRDIGAFEFVRHRKRRRR